jgi:hypothetical protein
MTMSFWLYKALSDVQHTLLLRDPIANSIPINPSML